MVITKHALARQQQRCIPVSYIKLILEYGTPKKRMGKAFEYRVLRKNRREFIVGLKQHKQVIDKIMGKCILVSNDGEIITVYNSYK